ncbi:MAG: acyloxyacyl hydrolase [Bacteroidia bacterium]
MLQNPVQAQFEAAFHYGRILKINPVFPEVSQDAWVATVGLPLALPNASPLHFWVHAQVYQFGNPAVLGYGVSLMPSLEFRFFASQNAWLSLRQGASFAYMRRPYDRDQNPTNNIIGAHLSLAAQTSIAWRQGLGDNLGVSFGGSFSHFSNGNSRVPNLGVNIPAAFLRVEWERSARPASQNSPESSKEAPKLTYWGLRLGLGTHAFKVPDGPNYLAWSISPFWSRQLKPQLALQVGLEWFYDGGSAAFAREQELVNVAWAGIGIAPYVGINYRINRLGLVLQSGPYLKTPFPHNWTVYTRLGMEYHWRDCFVGSYIHAHGGEADYLDFTLGWKLWH